MMEFENTARGVSEFARFVHELQAEGVQFECERTVTGSFIVKIWTPEGDV